MPVVAAKRETDMGTCDGNRPLPRQIVELTPAMDASYSWSGGLANKSVLARPAHSRHSHWSVNQGFRPSIPSEVVFQSLCPSFTNSFAGRVETKSRRGRTLLRAINLSVVISLLWCGSIKLCAQNASGSPVVPKEPVPPGEMLSSFDGQNVSSVEVAGRPD